MFRRRRRLLAEAELNGLIIILMRLDANVARIALEVTGEADGEA